PAHQRQHCGPGLPGPGAGGDLGHQARGGDVHHGEGAEVGARGTSKAAPHGADRSVPHRDHSPRLFAGRGDPISRPASNGRSKAMIIPLTGARTESARLQPRVNVVSFFVLLSCFIAGTIPTILTQSPFY